MGDIIAAIPLLLYSFVALFFSGLIIWMQNIHYVVGLVVMGGGIVAVMFYAGTTLLAIFSSSAPFRTPLSRATYALSRLPFSVVYLVAMSMSSFFSHLGNMLWPRSDFSTYEPSFLLWFKERHLEGTRFNERDDRVIQEEPRLGLDAMMWLASQLNISQVSFSRLVLFLSYQSWNGSFLCSLDLMNRHHGSLFSIYWGRCVSRRTRIRV